MGSLAPDNDSSKHSADSVAERNLVAWVRAAEYATPTPTSRASPGLVAHYLHEREIECDGEFTYPSIVRWCRERGIEPLPVILALRVERSGAHTYSVEDVTYTVDQGAWEQMEEDRETACCPVPHWVIGATTGAQMYSFGPCDDSLRCPDHADRKADAVLLAARRDWHHLDVVYHAVVPYDSGVINRVRSTRRPGRKGGRSCYVRRRDRGEGWDHFVVVETIHFFATADLSGPRTRKPPRSWEPLLPEEAIERLAEALRLPGVWAISPKWITKSDGDGQPADQDGEGDGDGVEEGDGQEGDGRSERFIALDSVMPETRDEVMEQASRIAEAKWGITPSPVFFPADVASVEEWATTIRDSTKVVRVRRRVEASKKAPKE